MIANLSAQNKESEAARPDAHFADDLQNQGNWIAPEHKCPHPIILEPSLRQFINLDPMTKVNLDKDVRPTGEFELYNISDKLSAVYSPDGRFQGSINSARLSTLSQAYTDRTYHKAGSFPQALASLLARYKDGHGSGHHTVPHKHCLSAPVGLVNKLIAALSITPELLASPLDFNPKR